MTSTGNNNLQPSARLLELRLKAEDLQVPYIKEA